MAATPRTGLDETILHIARMAMVCFTIGSLKNCQTNGHIFRLDVNYGGSSGYGRKYRERLKNRWGIVDTDDCISSVLELDNHLDLIDPKQVCIRGGSAGGFTTYAALSYGRYQGVFAAGTSIYGGVADLESLTKKAEKFELYYTEKFMGGTPDKIPWIYKQRAPLTHAGDIKVPLMVRFNLL